MINPEYTKYFVILFIFLVLSDFLYTKYKKRDCHKDLKDGFTSITLGLLFLLVQIIFAGLFIKLDLILYDYRLFDFGYNWLSITLCFISIDFTYYWWHRASHRVRVLWANHINHHSSQEYNFTTAFRQSLFEPILRPFFYIHLALLGFHPILVGIITSIRLPIAVLSHTKFVKNLGFLEKIIVTPSGHRVHHGTNPEYINKNYGGILMIWDVIFGTYQPEVNEVKYGITTNINTYNPVKIVFHEWIEWIKDLKKSKSLHEAYRQTVRGPEEII